MSRSSPGVFCIEGTWSSSLADRATVRDLLDVLENVDGVPYIHSRVTTEEGFYDVVRRWHQKQYSGYSLGYFAFHGRPGKLLIGRHSVSLKELGMVLQGACSGKILYFGSCSVLQVNPGEIDKFLRLTDADCVVGFNKDIDWLASAALDLILLQALALQEDAKEAERWMRHEYGALAEHLGLEVFYRPPDDEIAAVEERPRLRPTGTEVGDSSGRGAATIHAPLRSASEPETLDEPAPAITNETTPPDDHDQPALPLEPA